MTCAADNGSHRRSLTRNLPQKRSCRAPRTRAVAPNPHFVPASAEASKGKMMKTIFTLFLTATAALNTSCTAAETISKIKCEALGDAIIATNSGDLILEQRLIQYQELEEYGTNMTGKRGGQRALCTIKNDPPGYQWIACSKDGKDYTTYIMGSRKKIFEVEEAIANSVQHRGWSGACKVKL